MSETIERPSASLLHSDRFRRFAKQGVGSVPLRSTAFKKLNMLRHYLVSYYRGLRNPAQSRDVKTFCLFIGHNKSGTSLIGSLLDAHPNVILADEADALQYIPANFRRDQIYHILLRSSRREAMKGRVTARRLGGYSYWVPGQWQGRYNRVQVIGDSTSGSSTQRFANQPNLLLQLQTVMPGVNVKLIQVVRNPYDPISAMMVRGKRSFENSVEHYFTRCEVLVALRQRLNDSNLLAVRYEDFIHDPKMHLTQICRFLGIDVSYDYLIACTSILHEEPDQNRHMVQWDSKWIEVVKNRIGRYDFLEGYSF